MNQPALRSLTTKLYAFAFLEEFVLIYPLYTLLFNDRGLNAFQIASLLITWSGVAFLLEIPSGAIADKYSRKRVLLTAQVLRGLGFLVWFVFPTYAGFLAGFVLWGVSSALSSGTKEALVYDELTRIKQSSLYAKITGRMESLGIAGVILAAFAASALAGQGYGLILICSIVVAFGCMMPLALLPQAKTIESTSESDYFDYLKDGVREAFAKPVVLLTVLFLSVVTGFAASDEYFELLFREKGFDNTAIAFWVAIIGLFEIGGSMVAHKLEGRRFRLELVLIAWGGLLLAAATFKGIAVPLLIGAFSMIYYFIKILFGARLQHALGDATRATATSVSGFLSELGALVVFGVVGVTAQLKDYQLSFSALAFLVIAAAFLLWAFARGFRKERKINELGL